MIPFKEIVDTLKNTISFFILYGVTFKFKISSLKKDKE